MTKHVLVFGNANPESHSVLWNLPSKHRLLGPVLVQPLLVLLLQCEAVVLEQVLERQVTEWHEISLTANPSWLERAEVFEDIGDSGKPLFHLVQLSLEALWHTLSGDLHLLPSSPRVLEERQVLVHLQDKLAAKVNIS